MHFDPPLLEGILERRYKRFLADVRLPDGRMVTAHCPNTGSMRGCAQPGWRVWLSPATEPARKLAYTWELVEVDDGACVGVNTGRPNRVVCEALRAGLIPALRGYSCLRTEVRYGQEGSRIDILLDEAQNGAPPAWVEVKNVTLLEQGVALFPDAVTTRGQKHLRELMAVRATGQRAVVLFCVSHTAAQHFAPAGQIDPEYARLLGEAAAQGVEVMAWRCALSPTAWVLDVEIPVMLAG